jgi:hypothetical protein
MAIIPAMPGFSRFYETEMGWKNGDDQELHKSQPPDYQKKKDIFSR